jgi:uncharacterized protein YhfF
MDINFFLKQFAQQSGISEADALAMKRDKFGDSHEMADELLKPLLAGIKTATCSAVWEWEHDNEAIPYVGMLSVILNGKDEPVCIIETTEVTIKKYNEVDAQFASDEGEGDRSLGYWREVHERFFTRTLPRIGKEFSEDMPLVCERFKVVYKP